jgi:hypothetical protein
MVDQAKDGKESGLQLAVEDTFAHVEEPFAGCHGRERKRWDVYTVVRRS